MAIHEAGHAVVADHLGFVIDDVWIDPTTGFGRCTPKNPDDYDDESKIIVNRAGIVAEEIVFGNSLLGDADDKQYRGWAWQEDNDAIEQNDDLSDLDISTVDLQNRDHTSATQKTLLDHKAEAIKILSNSGKRVTLDNLAIALVGKNNLDGAEVKKLIGTSITNPA